MSAMAKMVGVEAKLFLRDPGGPITVIGLPVALLVVFGLMPGIREPSADFGGKSGLSVFIAPMAVAVLLGILALTIFPGVMATYREKGVLRRYSASPMSPRRLLGAQVLVNLVAGLVVVALGPEARLKACVHWQARHQVCVAGFWFGTSPSVDRWRSLGN
jgi:ABC-2 type transport system permease protein